MRNILDAYQIQDIHFETVILYADAEFLKIFLRQALWHANPQYV